MLVRLLMVLGLATLFICCSYDEHINDSNMPGNESSNQELEPEDKKKIDSPVTAFGVFSSRDSNGEHEWGYEVDLWEHNGDVIGMFTGSAGTRLVGDAPTGILKDVMYNFDTEIISFRATLPNVDYKFKGTLSKKELSGKLFDSRSEEAEKIVLLKSQELTAEMEEYPTLDAWKEQMSEIVRFRGVVGTVKYEKDNF